MRLRKRRTGKWVIISTILFSTTFFTYPTTDIIFAGEGVAIEAEHKETCINGKCKYEEKLTAVDVEYLRELEKEIKALKKKLTIEIMYSHSLGIKYDKECQKEINELIEKVTHSVEKVYINELEKEIERLKEQITTLSKKISELESKALKKGRIIGRPGTLVEGTQTQKLHDQIVERIKATKKKIEGKGDKVRKYVTKYMTKEEVRLLLGEPDEMDDNGEWWDYGDMTIWFENYQGHHGLVVRKIS